MELTMAEMQSAYKTYEKMMEVLEGAPDVIDGRVATPWEQISWLKRRVAELERQLNTPEVVDFVAGMNLEAAHQRERWGNDHDSGKTDADWFWLIGYLAGKALHFPEKRLHHLITCASALANWHLYTLGKTNMRPGIETPVGEHTDGHQNQN